MVAWELSRDAAEGVGGPPACTTSAAKGSAVWPPLTGGAALLALPFCSPARASASAWVPDTSKVSRTAEEEGGNGPAAPWWDGPKEGGAAGLPAAFTNSSAPASLSAGGQKAVPHELRSSSQVAAGHACLMAN